MKKSFWLFATSFLLLTFTACEQGLLLNPDFDLTEYLSEISVSELPADVAEAVENLFPNVAIESALAIHATDNTQLFAVGMANGEERTFQRDGRMCNDTIPVSSLRANILSYIDTNYPDEVILKAAEVVRRDSSVIYVVHISSGVVLAFDEDGEFLGEHKRRRKHRGHKDNKVLIDPADLPQAVQTALATDYPNNAVDKAIELKLRDESLVYLIKLADGSRVAYAADGTELENFGPSWRQGHHACPGGDETDSEG